MEQRTSEAYGIRPRDASYTYYASSKNIAYKLYVTSRRYHYAGVADMIEIQVEMFLEFRPREGFNE